MDIGLFDHLDFRGEPAAKTYAERLALVRAADQAGFRAYHLAEHHGTPIGMAPSPGVFLAAVARETRRIRFGPMVYCLPLYIPLRLLEEICMLDHLGEGRLDVGVGRGASPFETGFYGVPPEESVDRYVEALEVLRLGLSADMLNFEGRWCSYRNVPLTLRPYQARIPFWSAPGTAEAQAFAARLRMHIMILGANDRVREMASAYREQWTAHSGNPGEAAHGPAEPFIGAYRIVHTARTDREAEGRARPAFRRWFDSLAHLWRQNNATTPFLAIGDFDNARKIGMVITGSPSRVRDELTAQIESCGYNYPVLQFAFGDLGHRAEMASLSLFAEKVMPDIEA